MITGKDYEYMARALQLAALGIYTTHPNPRVGCVLVKDENIVGAAWHQRAGEPHAEVLALRQAGDRAYGSTAYVTLEPCSHHGRTPPCVDSLIKAGVKRVVAAVKDPNPLVNGKGIERLKSAGVQVDVGLLETQAIDMNRGFFHRVQQQRPYVRVKLATSLDGRTAMASGESQWISGESARLDVQRLRASSAAVMVGINTVLADDPALSVRLESLQSAGELRGGSEIQQPLRIVLDSRFRLPLNARLLKLPGDILIVTAVDDESKRAALVSDNIEVIQVAAGENGCPDLHDVMSVLASAEINEVLVEAGGILAGALLTEQLIDELVLYVAPCVLGNSGKGLFNLPHLHDMASKILFDIQEVRPVGDDLRITAKPKYTASE